jgi:pimeloyl-ACP methyl ester carboxylesterase
MTFSKRDPDIRQVSTLLLVLWLVVLLPAVLLLFWWFWQAESWAGKGLAIIGFLLVDLPVLVLLWDSRRISGDVLKLAVLPVLGLSAGIFAAMVLAAPDGNPGDGSPVQQRFTGDSSFQRFALTNIVPEIEQINLGFIVMPFLDSILTHEQAREVAPFTLELYREMEQDENFRQLGSVMGDAYAQLAGLPIDKGHYYLYVPQNRPARRLPAVVFLHGSAGNFKVYTWLWSKLAEEEGFVIIAPSYGFGNWDQSGVESVLRAIEDVGQVVELDADRIYLAGLSNGGLGVSRLAAEVPELFRGLIFISPVMATDIVDEEPFHRQWAERPVLVITGEADDRIPLSYVEQRVAIMQAGNVDVTGIVYPGENHFLFFSQADSILEDIAAWLR